MNLKSYTRGIGAGLIVSALVLGIGNKTEKMTDAQIKARALEMGMIEAQTLTQITNDSSKEEVADVITSSEDPVPEFKEPDEITVQPILTEEESETVSSDVASDNETEEVDLLENDDNQEVVTNLPDGAVEVQIVRGDSSVKASRKLYEAGVVESAVEFDKYLCQNGYDRYISVGTYTINAGATFEEIAKIITRKQD